METMIPADDPVRLLSAFVEGMDLSRIDAYDIIDGRAVNIYFASTASEADEVLPEKDAYNIAEAIGYCRSHMVRIKVYRGETTRLDYDYE